MKITQTDKFQKNLKRLPKGTIKIYEKQEKIFSVNWKDPRLHMQKLKGDGFVFSFRITRKYRVLFNLVETDSALFVSIGHRKDICD